MKLHSASRTEIKRVSSGTLVCDGIMIAALFFLSSLGIGVFDPGRILLGAALGSAAAILNFTLLCFTVQGAVEIEDQKKRKARFQISYHFRMLFQAVWVLIAFLIPQIHVVAGAAPLLFPNLTIFCLQTAGRLLPPDPPREKPAPEA